MEKNNIITPPQIANADACFETWHNSGHWGSMTDFYKFITAPSPERDRFVMEQNIDLKQFGSVVAPTII